MNRTPGILLAALLIALTTSPLAATTEYEGTTAGGAYYRIAVPDNWNGDLVIWNRGFSFSGPKPVTDLGVLAEIQMIEGFAVAASSLRQGGWALFKSNKDLRALVAAFRRDVGRTPGRIIISGGSLGGGVAVHALEKGRLPNVVGAYTVCGAVGGSRSWDGGLDLRLAYDVICAGIPEAAIPGGPTGLERNSDWTPEDVERAVNACTGIDRLPSRRSRAQKRNLARLLELAQIPPTFLQPAMDFATRGLADLTFDRGKLKGRQGIGNENVDYGDAELNAAIQRVAPQKRAAKKLAKSFTPTGKVKGAKIVNLHTSGDGLVIVENQSEYAAVVPPENLTIGIVVERVPSHCFFSPAEVLAGWESTLAWINGGEQPTAADIQANCEEIADVLGGPCRIDPDYEIADMDGRIRPRGD